MRLVSLDELLQKINALPRFNRSADIMELYNGGGDVAFLAKDIQEMINNQLTIYKMRET